MDSKTAKPQNIELSMPVQYLKGVGPAKAKLFAELEVHTVEDLLEYYPRDWIFAPKTTKIDQIKPGVEVTVQGLVESTDCIEYRRPAMFEVYLSDDTDVVRVIWFGGQYLKNQIEPGQMLIASGKVTVYKHQRQLTNPKFKIIDQPEAGPEEAKEYFSGGVYPARKNLSSGQIKKIIRPVVEQTQSLVDDFFPPDYLKKRNLIPRGSAFQWIHQPKNEDQLRLAKRRLKYDELSLMQLGLAARRYSVRSRGAPPMSRDEKIDTRIRKRFPFLLTEDQSSVIDEITADMSGDVPMNRLLQGDVGSGKTVVALYAALLAVAHKYQVAIMAPTEVLAEQHFISIERYLRKSKVSRTLITGGLTGLKRKALLTEIKQGRIDIVVGTVALLQKDIEFNRLGLVIIDEQHKFGVEQRGRLRKDTQPHVLVMTATPIPRTLAMTAFGDLDVSIIRHSPPGRGTVVTRWVDKKDRTKAYEFIRQRLKAKKQAFFVYPRVIADDNGQVRAATDECKLLSKEIYPEFNVALLHGKMTSEQKKTVMDDFRRGKTDLLVSTVVIEVGVDVPNATIMVIEGADRFGLAQLHQLRGRIGRGQSKSYCLLFCDNQSEVAANRLQVMERTNDGFEIAEYDLRLRGPGEMFSTRQHGLPDLKIANIIDDFELLNMARKDAFQIINADPALRQTQHQNLRRALIKKFGKNIGLVDIG